MRTRTIGNTKVLALLGVCSVLATWEVLSVTGILREPFIPSVKSLLLALPTELSTQALWEATGYTVLLWLMGLLVATVIGIGLGIVLGVSRLLNSLVSPIVELLRPIPFIAILPLAAIAFGLTTSLEFWMVVYAVVWPITVQTSNGIRTISPVIRDSARIYRIKGPRALINVYLPAISPYIATGIKFGASLGLIVAVTVELLAGTPGLGYRVLMAQHSADYGQMYLDIMLSGLMGYGGYLLTTRLERLVLHWHPKFRKESDVKSRGR